MLLKNLNKSMIHKNIIIQETSQFIMLLVMKMLRHKMLENSLNNMVKLKNLVNQRSSMVNMIKRKLTLIYYINQKMQLDQPQNVLQMMKVSYKIDFQKDNQLYNNIRRRTLHIVLMVNPINKEKNDLKLHFIFKQIHIKIDVQNLIVSFTCQLGIKIVD